MRGQGTGGGGGEQGLTAGGGTWGPARLEEPGPGTGGPGKQSGKTWRDATRRFFAVAVLVLFRVPGPDL